ncbi:MAG TPA: prolyl oligopeptidase family serine peptidase [Rhizomicrobium sp.]|jgi:prolyl oligopeptidase|nr:prolyl oligopeptidase family serine peptidase [Rhizomicrobium sp.]
MTRSSLLASAAVFAAAATLAVAAGNPGPVQPGPIAPSPVTETLYGHSVTDTYRGMEKLDTATTDWMKAQGAYTRSVMDAIPGRADLGKRVGAFTGSFGFINNYARFGGREFYEERAPGADNFDLVVRDARGTRKIVDITAVMAAHGGKPYAINYIAPSPDGSKVAVGLSEGGSEDAQLTVYDAATGAAIAGPVDRAQYGVTSWGTDSKSIYFIRMKQLKPTDPGTEKYRDASLAAWDLRSDPVPLYGALLPTGPKVGSDETPVLVFTPGSSVAAFVSVNGVQNEYKVWLAPAATAADPAKARWTLLADRDAGITALDMKGDTVFLLSHKDAPTFQVLALKAGQPLASAKVLVAADPKRVIESVHAAADGLYVTTTRGVYSELLRVDYKTGAATPIPLPARGHVGGTFSDPREPGVEIDVSSWIVPPTEYRYEPKSGKFADLGIGAKGDFDPAQYHVDDLLAPAKDGVMVPLSLMSPKGAAKPGIVVVEAYGSYGISNLADFSTRRAVFVKEGISYGVCHVRGGGELGDAWRLAGKDADKHNTWQDQIACGDLLVKQGVTTPSKLFIMGGSAGGITMGRAMEERPDLFAGVIDAVPSANPLRMEFTPNGPDNIPEFGTIAKQEGFDNLWAMDSVQHVVDGTHYPAIMISTGLNDPRVAPWVPAKFAATLLAAHPSSPVLLRIDAQAGHGIGSTRSQTDALTADWIAFVRWRAGEAAWQPDFTKH